MTQAADDIISTNRTTREAYLVVPASSGDATTIVKHRKIWRRLKLALRTFFAGRRRAGTTIRNARSLLRDGEGTSSSRGFYKHLIDHHLRAGRRQRSPPRAGLRRFESIDLAVLHADLLIDDRQFAEAAQSMIC